MVTASGVSSMMISTPCGLFQGAYIASLTADDASLSFHQKAGEQLKWWSLPYGLKRTLDGRADDLPCFFISCFLDLFIHMAQAHGFFIKQFFIKAAQKNLSWLLPRLNWQWYAGVLFPGPRPWSILHLFV
jgi:hypothetical protein